MLAQENQIVVASATDQNLLHTCKHKNQNFSKPHPNDYKKSAYISAIQTPNLLLNTHIQFTSAMMTALNTIISLKWEWGFLIAQKLAHIRCSFCTSSFSSNLQIWFHHSCLLGLVHSCCVTDTENNKAVFMIATLKTLLLFVSN